MWGACPVSFAMVLRLMPSDNMESADDSQFEAQVNSNPLDSETLDSDWTFTGDLASDGLAEPVVPVELFGDCSVSLQNFSEHSGEVEKRPEGSDCPSPSTPAAESFHDVTEQLLDTQTVVSSSQWQLGVAANHGQFSNLPNELLLPWETGIYAEIFGSGSFLQMPGSHVPEPDAALMDQVISASDALAPIADSQLDSCFDKAVRNIQDLEYFENKSRQLELACGQWLELLSCNWYASGVGEMLARDMQKDATAWMGGVVAM